MAELRQRRGLNKKHIELLGDNEIAVKNTRLFKCEGETFRLAECHPFFERVVNNAFGYLFGAGVLFLLALVTYYCTTDAQMKIAAPIFIVTGIVTAVLYVKSKVSRYDFFERGTGKFLFRIWRTRKGDEKQFIDQLMTIINERYNCRFRDARQIINSPVRKKIAEQGTYYLYEQGLLEFSEFESLIINIENRFHKPIGKLDVLAEANTNVIDFERFAKERMIETS